MKWQLKLKPVTIPWNLDEQKKKIVIQHFFVAPAKQSAT